MQNHLGDHEDSVTLRTLTTLKLLLLSAVNIYKVETWYVQSIEYYAAVCSLVPDFLWPHGL